VARIAGAPKFFLSGTASIVGHESRHIGDPAAQARETMTNIAAMREQALRKGLPKDRAMLFKAYVRRPEFVEVVKPVIEEHLQQGDQVAFLVADICRPDLLLEIDGASA